MTDIPYRLVRSRRRTLALVITRQGILEVRAPLRLSPQAIEEFVDQKRDWIAARMAERERVVLPPFRWGNTVPFWGREAPVLPGEEACFDSGRFSCPSKRRGIGSVYAKRWNRYTGRRPRPSQLLDGAGGASYRLERRKGAAGAHYRGPNPLGLLFRAQFPQFQLAADGSGERKRYVMW